MILILIYLMWESNATVYTPDSCDPENGPERKEGRKKLRKLGFEQPVNHDGHTRDTAGPGPRSQSSGAA